MVECMWHCCEKAQEVNAWFHRLSNGLLRCAWKIGWICVTTSLPFRSCPPSLEKISSAQYKSNCSLCGFCIVCWHGAEPSFLRFAGQPTTILLFFHQSRRIFITRGVLDIYVWNLILICLCKHTNISLTSPRGVNAWGNVWIQCSSPPLLPASSFTQKLLGSEGLVLHLHQIFYAISLCSHVVNAAHTPAEEADGNCPCGPMATPLTGKEEPLGSLAWFWHGECQCPA